MNVLPATHRRQIHDWSVLSMKALLPLLTALLIAAMLSSAAASESSSKGQTILIMDSSGSMWGRIGNRTKIEIARETAAELVRNRPAEIEMGFMAYGHRRKGDCDDIELMVPPSSETTGGLLVAIEQMVPKGSTPIYKSVMQAAESLHYTEQPASVILVSDGIETCDGDLAALGKLLAEQGIDFKTHIIGFAMKDADTVQLRELATATGGTYADAGDAASLASALRAAVTVAVKSPTTLTLVPIGDDGKSVLRSGVSFALYNDKADETPVATGTGGQFDTELEPGSYLATATFGGRTLEAPITAAEGRTTNHRFTFTAPVLTLQAVLEEGGEPLTDGVSWGVFGPPNAEGKRQQVAFSYDATAKLRIGPGDYQIVARRGSAQVSKDISFGEEPLTVSMVFGAGTLTATAALSKDAEAISSGLSWGVLGDPDNEGKRPQIAFSYDAQPTWTLPAGSYLLKVNKGSSSVGEQVEITAGEQTRHQIIMGSGTVVANAIMSAGIEPVTGSGLSWGVFGEPDAEGKRPQVAFSYDAAPRFTLLAGDYSVKVTRDSATASQDVSVAPGETQDLTLNLNAAILEGSIVMTEGGEVFNGNGLSWGVFGPPNAEGKRPQVAYSYNAQPRFSLPVGRYLLRVTRGNASVDQDIVVEAGKFNSVVINMNAGLIKVTLVDSKGTPIASKPSWSVLGPPDAEGKRQQIGYSYDKEPTFVLPAGKWMIRARFDGKSVEAEVEVTPGRLTEFTLKAEQ
ncbi:vWA domain-containing protein [Thiorhodovibrio litoralis]|uniref:vWA domain-containing protein n=1 Tax=Thiorhodovibrio litoralis TaxID=2952932 RepID=UPI002B25D207|nr:VWA domain-containing protein [Thiorhodovibrio litoralis]